MAVTGNNFAKAICEVLGIDVNNVAEVHVTASPRELLKITMLFHPNISDDDMYNIKETVEDAAKVVYVTNL